MGILFIDAVWPKFESFDHEFEEVLNILGLSLVENIPFIVEMEKEDVLNFAIEECIVYMPDRIKEILIKTNSYLLYKEKLNKDLQILVNFIFIIKNYENMSESYKSQKNYYELMMNSLKNKNYLINDDTRRYYDQAKNFFTNDPFIKNLSLLETFKHKPKKFISPYIFTHLDLSDYLLNKVSGESTKKERLLFINELLRNIQKDQIDSPTSELFSFYLTELNYDPYLLYKIKENKEKFANAAKDNNYNRLRGGFYQEFFSLLCFSPDVGIRSQLLNVFNLYTNRNILVEFGISINSTADLMNALKDDIAQYIFIFQVILRNYALYLFDSKNRAFNYKEFEVTAEALDYFASIYNIKNATFKRFQKAEDIPIEYSPNLSFNPTTIFKYIIKRKKNFNGKYVPEEILINNYRATLIDLLYKYFPSSIKK